MVGVAGKSQGCTTCRRRKIKCDERKPNCARCERSKFECEGYERYPVFIDRTQKGLRKRQPLEETKKASPSRVTTLASPDAEATRLISWFWESFARSPPSRNALISPSRWVDHFLAGYSSCPPLKHALLAVSITKLGKNTGRTDVLTEGRRLYSQSLALTRKALTTSNLVIQDDILAATCVMVLYELLDATRDGMDGWLNHLDGLSRLLQYRGPQMYASPAARAIFEHGRYLLMLQHLLARKGSVFSQPAWIEVPWQGAEKGIEQKVFDDGLRLAAIFERCDRAADQSLKLSDGIELFQECNELYDRLESLHEEHIAPAIAADLACVEASIACSGRIENPASFLLSITALGIQLGACASANDSLSQAIEPSLTALDLCDTNSSNLRRFTERKSHLLSNRHRLARRILHSITFCLTERMGSMGAARMLLSLRIAIQQFQPAEPEFEQCQSLIRQLCNRASRLDASLRSNQSVTANIVLYDKTNLVQENAVSIGQQWLRFADSVGSKENGLEALPVDVEGTISGIRIDPPKEQSS